MPRRIGRPGLIGTMARTAVVAGTATAVAGGVNRRQQSRAQASADEQAAAEQQQYEAQQYEAQQARQAEQAQQAPEPAAAAGGDDLSAQIEKLATLKTAGVISDEEFAAAKAKLLGM
ncbi:SHOCT domain-containing protein [Cryobacterium sp. TMT1-21]|uniref:SHOCT domain-containing protein n=1 Tax=Cryobacterium shii TaxID=1259235 RepID=A0AAQ2HEI0_9MICO|nr:MULTISPECIES: SHOCT domain-containing protein [Cryobacterium]TFC42551.1 SHOCT domain-containing protein [Cryobacterium shii]TFC80883.1 SHOCT domain-containing protein [Cryobacterium sp. TmT2-59]TFD13190.1 SHOCT domain-containing protein [Cryobacterium sp. TMT1-21]TFD18611.1 SHOCT domain-containing protein [Cryobacterium sp. TMT4-10]TFD28412.1 SHOCT domain-containing protein [Cryobacterium sp. TMT2-23]